MLGDWVHQFASATGSVLDSGRRVVVYNGKDDYICNYVGGEGWTNVTQWKEQVRERRSTVCYDIYSRSVFSIIVPSVIFQSVE